MHLNMNQEVGEEQDKQVLILQMELPVVMEEMVYLQLFPVQVNFLQVAVEDLHLQLVNLDWVD